MIYIFGGAFDPPHVGHTAIIRSLLHFHHPMKVVILPSGKRNDKEYSVSDEHRLQMIQIFCDEINRNQNEKKYLQKEERVILDDYFIRQWEGEMITRDVDEYARNTYGEDIIHIFGTDTIDSMSDWDNEQYAAKVVKKLFIPRNLESTCHHEEANNPEKPKEIIKNDPITGYLAMTEKQGIENFEFFTESRIPDISSTDIRLSIPKYSTIHARYEDDPRFIIPGLSKKISQYILQNKLYRFSPHEKGEGEGVFRKKKPKILVHVCCGPDVTMPILELREDYDLVCFWYDPNIQPKSEYDKRFDAFKKVCELENIPYIKGAYDVDHFFSRIKGLEHTPEKGEKCTHCYDMRMYVAAKLAKKLGIKLYTSSLNTSPKKDLEKLFKMGHQYALKYGVEFLDIPFRKNGGFEKSVAYTTKHDIYRQNYCGCIYSVQEGGDSELKRRMVG